MVSTTKGSYYPRLPSPVPGTTPGYYPWLIPLFTFPGYYLWLLPAVGLAPCSPTPHEASGARLMAPDLQLRELRVWSTWQLCGSQEDLPMCRERGWSGWWLGGCGLVGVRWLADVGCMQVCCIELLWGLCLWSGDKQRSALWDHQATIILSHLHITNFDQHGHWYLIINLYEL